MANSRIRYLEVQPGVLRSRRHFVTTYGVEVAVELDLVNKTYQILNSSSGEVLGTGGDTVNLNVLKTQAKQGLVAMGVEFIAEDRNRGDEETHSPLSNQIG